MSENQNELPQMVEGGLQSFNTDIIKDVLNKGADAIVEINRSENNYKTERDKSQGEADIAKSKNEAKADGNRYEADYAKVSEIAKSDMDSKDKKDVLINVSNNEVEKEKIIQENRTARDKNEATERTKREEIREKWKTIRWLGIGIIGGVLGVVSIFKKPTSNGNQMSLMTMDNLIKKVPVKSDLEHHYIEVLRAMGQMKPLKNEEKELWEQLQLLKKILEALIFKGVYGAKLRTGAMALKKLLNEIKNDPNGTNSSNRWMEGLGEEEKRTLRCQVREICAYLDGRMER